MSPGKYKILFLCTGNSCRSQMAEGFAKTYFDIFEAYSAGIEPEEKVDEKAVQVMKEIGIDISNQKPKDLKSLMDIDFDFVITLCDNAKEKCPFYPKKSKIFHKSFEDPKNYGKIEFYRKIRDSIKEFILTLPEFLKI